MNIKDFSQPTILSGKQYGTTVRIELDHSDTSIDEVMDGMLTIVKGLGYLDGTINEWIKDRSMDIYEDEHSIISKSLADDWFDEEDETDEEIENYFNNVAMDTNYGLTDDEYNDFVDSNWDEERIDIIGQNGNEGTHYGLATDEDIEECELNDTKIYPTHDCWCGNEGKCDCISEPNDNDEAEFNDYGMRIEPNAKLKAATQRYSEEVRSKHKRIKLDKTKVRKGKIKDLKK